MPIVNSAPSTSMVLAPVMVIGAVTLLVPVLTAKVPPFKVIGSANPVTFRKSRVAPPLTVVPADEAPRASALVIARVPPSTVVVPV